MAEIHFSCPHCGAKLHIDQQFVGRLTKCPKCSQTSTISAPLAQQGQDDSLVVAENISARRSSETFAVQLTRAFSYPFKGSGPILLAIGTIGLVLLKIVSPILIMFSGCFGLLAALFAYVFTYGYLSAFAISIISSSATGEDELPDWPDFTGFWSDILRPVLLIIATAVMSLLPLFISVTFVVIFVLKGSFFDIPEIRLTLGYALIACMIWALLYFPMGLLAIAMFDSVAALNPVLMVKSISKIPLRYLLACLFFFLVFFLNSVLAGYFTQIPIVGLVVRMFCSFYLMMVAMRILGLLYKANARKLDWLVQ